MVTLLLSITWAMVLCSLGESKNLDLGALDLFDLLSADDIKSSLHLLSKSRWTMVGGNREWPGWWPELEIAKHFPTHCVIGFLQSPSRAGIPIDK